MDSNAFSYAIFIHASILCTCLVYVKNRLGNEFEYINKETKLIYFIDNISLLLGDRNKRKGKEKEIYIKQI